MTPTPEDPTKLDLARAMEDLAAPAHVVDCGGRFRWLNRAHIELFGDGRGRPFLDSVVLEHRQLARTNLARTVVGRTTTIFDLIMLDRDGERLTLRITSAPLREHDEVVGSFGIGFPLAHAVTPTSSVLDELTPRQLEVLRLLAEGLETPEIARRLGVADETARNHIRALLRSTGAHSRLEVVLLGIRLGVVAAN
jgi:DNA-binding CsgD family transcriptional regulator